MRWSVIIPTLNEAAHIRELIEFLLVQPRPQDGLEILVVDGGSSDDTVELAQEAGARVIISERPGRAVQLALGAEQAQGPLLYFLHADSVPPSDCFGLMEAALDSGSRAGTFRLQFEHQAPMMRFYSYMSRFRLRICRGGDASLFVERALYNSIGGFRQDLPIMEDIELFVRLRKVTQLAIINQPVRTSARRYERNGTIRLQLIFGAIHLGYWLGASPTRLHKFYKRFVG